MREVGLSVFGPPGLGAPNEHAPTIAVARSPKQYFLNDYGTTSRSTRSFRINKLRVCDPRNITQVDKIVGNLVKDGLGRAQQSGDLRKFIEAGKKIIISTVQKFPFILDEIGNEQRSRRFAIIIDEAHSSQGGRTSASISAALGGGR